MNRASFSGDARAGRWSDIEPLFLNDLIRFNQKNGCVLGDELILRRWLGVKRVARSKELSNAENTFLVAATF